jgi:hypothetical protein
MAYYPISTEAGAVYTLIGPDGATAAFNVPSDPNYVGMLKEVTGLDSPEIRESAQELVEADGGAHGSFFFGRRPVVMNAVVFNYATIAERTLRVDRARRASNALRANGELRWKPSDWATRDYIEVYLPFRRQQPFRETGAWVKELQIPLVSEYATIQSVSTVTVAGGVATENRGNAPAFPVVEITGASANCTVSDGTRTFRTTGLAGGSALASGEKLKIDFQTHTAVFTAGARSGQSGNRYIDFSTTQWPYLSGNGTSQTFTLVGGGTLSVTYRHCWA